MTTCSVGLVIFKCYATNQLSIFSFFSPIDLATVASPPSPPLERHLRILTYSSNFKTITKHNKIKSKHLFFLHILNLISDATISFTLPYHLDTRRSALPQTTVILTERLLCAEAYAKCFKCLTSSVRTKVEPVSPSTYGWGFGTGSGKWRDLLHISVNG